MSGDGVTPFTKYNFGSLERFHTLKNFWYDAGGSLKSIDSILPNIPANFPGMRFFRSNAGGIYSTNTRFNLPDMKEISAFDVTPPALIDSFINQIAATSLKDTGWIYLGNAGRSALSDAAITTLKNRKWKIALVNDAYDIKLIGSILNVLSFSYFRPNIVFTPSLGFVLSLDKATIALKICS